MEGYSSLPPTQYIKCPSPVEYGLPESGSENLYPDINNIQDAKNYLTLSRQMVSEHKKWMSWAIKRKSSGINIFGIKLFAISPISKKEIPLIFHLNKDVTDLDKFTIEEIEEMSKFWVKAKTYAYDLLSHLEIRAKTDLALRWKEPNHWSKLKGYELEDQVTQLFEHIGMKTRVTQKSSDGGVDVIATHKNTTFIIQCKGWEGKVGVKETRELAGVIATEYPESCGIMIGTNGFTKSARAFGANADLRFWDSNSLASFASRS